MAAEDKGPPPEELQVAWLCARHPGALPDDGPVMEQDYFLMLRMGSLQNVYNVIQKYRSLTGDDINKRLSVGERILLGKLDEMGLIGGLRRG